MFDLQAIAFQSDLTRVSTMMLGREGSVRSIPKSKFPTRTIRLPITAAIPIH